MEKKSITYEYKTLTVNRKLELQWQDGLEKFGWELVSSSPEKIKPVWGPFRIMLAPLSILPGPCKNLVNGHDSQSSVELKLKRDKNLPNKNELNRLQGYFENTMNEMEHMERTKMVTAYIGSSVCGLLGTVFMTLSVFTVIAGNVIGCIGFAVPGFIAWVLGAALYYILKGRREKSIEKEYEQKYEIIDDICERAYILL